ncbi:MAG: hypothetical protein ACTSU7_06410 [Candidatus Heimdallarchaeaceae archaeon]
MNEHQMKRRISSALLIILVLAMVIFPFLHLYVLLPSIEIAGEGLEGINGHITYHCTLVNHGYAGKLNVTFIYEGENGETIIRNKIVHMLAGETRIVRVGFDAGSRREDSHIEILAIRRLFSYERHVNVLIEK